MTQAQVDAAKLTANRAAANVAMLSAAEAKDVANRAAFSQVWTDRNDVAEVVGALLSIQGITAARIASQIASMRAGNPVSPEAPTPEIATDRGTRRLLQTEIVINTQANTLSGGGDPLNS